MRGIYDLARGERPLHARATVFQKVDEIYQALGDPGSGERVF